MIFNDILAKAGAAAESAVGTSETDYIGEDGLLYCGNCHTPKQTRIPAPGMNGKEITVSCMCKCKTEERDNEERQWHEMQRLEEIKRIRECSGLSKRQMEYCFSNDNGNNKRIMDYARLYVEKWGETSKGLLFYGGVGNGKTFAACSIANALIDKGVHVMVTDFNYILNGMQSYSVGDKNAFIQSFTKSSLLIIDDLGTERNSDYALSVVEQVINERYNENKPLILTTNIPIDTIRNPKDIKYARVYSRIIGMTVPIMADGQDNRIKDGAENIEQFKKLLGAGGQA